MHNQEILNVKNLYLRLIKPGEDTNLLSDISFQLHAKESLAIVGPSGAGKSLIGKALIGLLPKNIILHSGNISFNSKNLGTMTDAHMKTLRGNKIGMVFQNPASALHPLIRMGIQLTEGLRKHTLLTKKERIEKILFLLEKVKIKNPHHFIKLFPFEISGGMKQRAAVVMALACSPDLIIADEPTTALDCISQFHLLTLLRDLTVDLGSGLLLITHNMALLEDFCDRMLVFNKGKIVEEGKISTVLNNPKHEKTISLIKNVPGIQLLDHHLNQKIQKSDQRVTTSLHSPVFVKKINTPLISIRNLFYRPTSTQDFILKNLSLDIFKGECIGLVGASGSGKSTLASILSGLATPSSGSILLNNQPWSSSRSLLRSGKIRLIFQDSEGALNPKMTVMEIIREPLALLKQFSLNDQKEKVHKALDSVGLSPQFLIRFPSELSGGQQQRICIARALVSQPECVICDEPLSSLDSFNQKIMLDLFLNIKKSLGTTLLFISHDLPTVKFFTDKIMVMNQGKIVENLPSYRFFEEAKDAYTQSLLATIPSFYKKYS
ncbi:Glutathione import ATP-binding protein GsiA [Candidatus Clavichlamydia salmonicola]|uniref:ABC transporter ATP-binding protein n=1 Tax=Candidatus Clavichlamydia salmonicola TaxID=469812 RepID=UPI00189131B4|nr:ABC transporter ATP-binding protein [Candidatus Clavichlamydia salmonicola]MBF5051177.1 Glutathione import ATP-binding protein GsiA [Candidatus Clavichlamydia salmonicola]